MAAILQFRQGSKTSFITSGPYISEPFFDTDTNIIHIGVGGSSTITLTKLEDINSGSFSISGDFSGSNLSLSGDITASNANLSGDITIGGNIILGDQIQDTITVSGQFDSDLIPSESLQYTLGSLTKKWKHLYAESASIDSVNLVANLPSGVISGSSQISAFGFDGYGGWTLHDNSVQYGAYVSSGDIVYLVGRNGILGDLDTPDPFTRYLYFDLDTGSVHFTDAVAAVGAPQGTVSGSQQVIDLLPSGVISGSEQLPQGTVSGSTQITDGSNIVSSSQQVTDFLPSGTISGSTQITDGSTILSSSIQTNGFDSYSTDVDNRLTPLETSTNALNAISHSHSNKVELDTINQELSTTSEVSFLSLQTTNQLDVGGRLEVIGTSSFGGDVTVYGDLSIFGTQSIINSTNLAIADNMIYLNSGSTVTNPDLGFAGNYNDGTYAHAGLFRDASDNGIWKFYEGYVPEPEGSIDTSHITFELAPLEVESVTATLIQAENFQGTGSNLVFPGTNIVSSSQQVVNFLPNGTVSGSSQVLGGSSIVSSSQQVVNFLPSGTVSGSSQVLGGTNIVSSSVQVTDFLPIGTVSSSVQIIQVLETQTPGLVSGSDQVTQSLDLRYLEINGDNILSSSNENFLDYSQSVDLRLLNTLSSGSETSQSLHTLVGSFPTSGSLGSAAFYNVSNSLDISLDTSSFNDSVLLTAGAVKTYVNEYVQILGGADITGVSASLGLSGGGDNGYVSLSLDTASAHFQAGVELYGTSQVEVVNILNDSNVISSSLQLNGENLNLGIITGSDILSTGNVFADGYIQSEDGLYVGINGGQTQFSVNQTGDTVIRGTLEIGSAIGGITDVSASISSIDVLNVAQNNRLDSLESLSSSLDSNVSTSEILIKNTDGTFTGSNSFADSNNLSVGTNAPSNLGATQFTINDSNTPGQTGLISFTDSGVVKSFDYALSDVRYIDSNAGVSITIKPDADPNKAWIFDTDGDLVSNNGSWNSGNLYLSNIIARNAVTASNILVDNIVVNGTGSFAYIESVTGSAKIIGDSFIILNNNTPAERYAGISVQDSGSAGVTASLQFDGLTNDWFYEYSDDGGVTTDHGVTLFGPEYATKGTPTYPTNNTIQKGNGGHHLLDSNITDDGSTITLGSNTTVSGDISATKTAGTEDTTLTLTNGDGSVELTKNSFNGLYLKHNTSTVYQLNSNNDQFWNGAGNYGGKFNFNGGIAISGASTIFRGLNGLSVTSTISSTGVISGSAIHSENDITAEGDVIVYSTSDKRLKENITPIKTPLQKINSIGGYSFDWNVEKQDIYKGKDYGVIAQEIEEILPELVDTRKSGYKAVKYDKLVSLLIEGVKELSSEVEALKQQINS